MSEWKEPTNAAEELLCAVPCIIRDSVWGQEAIAALQSHASALDRIAALEAENARLRHHAEAMAKSLDEWSRIDECKCGALDAYRAEFPEGSR